MKRSFALATSAVTIAAAALLAAAPVARATVNCNLDESTHHVSVTPALAGDAITLSIGSGGAILAGGASCAGPSTTATLANAVLIEVHDSDPLVTNNDFTLDLSGGPFVKADGTEVPVEITTPSLMLGDDPTQFFKILGSSAAQHIRFGDIGGAGGDVGVDLTGDGDVDLSISDVRDYGEGDRYLADLGGGNDTFNASTGASLGFTGSFPVEVAPSGGSGSDTITGSAAADPSVSGGDGNDTLDGGDGNDTLSGGTGDDRLAGGAGNDSESGGTGNDTFAEGAAPNGSDTLGGGADSDFVDYGARTAAVTVDQDTLPNDGESTEADNISGMEKVSTGSGVDLITATLGNDTIDAGGGNDTVDGLGGNDRIDGGDGNDTISGGDGNDTLVSSSGTDVLNGGAGDDKADMGPAADGPTTFNGGTGTDTADYGARTSTVYVVLNNVASDGQPGEGDMVNGADVENVVTGSGSDVVNDLVGKKNVISLGAGDDQSSAGAGNDVVNGNSGNDTLNGDEGNDTINGNAGADTVDGDEGADYVSGQEDNDLVIGGTGSDHVYGGFGNDQLKIVDDQVDYASCGAGSDKASADKSPSDSVGTSCESVKRI